VILVKSFRLFDQDSVKHVQMNLMLEFQVEKKTRRLNLLMIQSNLI